MSSLRDPSTLPPAGKTIALGFDVGGNTTKIGLVTRDGEISAYREIPSPVQNKLLEEYLERLQTALLEVLSHASSPVVGVGATFLGWINEERSGPFFCMNSPQLHNFNFRRWIEDAFQLPVVLHDDVTAHTLAEYHFGSGKGCRRFLCLAMGTGLGAGVMVDGKPLQFTGGCAGDTGHLILRPGGPACTAGCKGCAEAFIGTAGIEHLMFEKSANHLPAGDIIRRAAAGTDAIACEVMGSVGGYTGELLASLFPVFVPEMIALTGGTSAAGKILLDAARTRFFDLMGEYCRNFAVIAGRQPPGVEIVIGNTREKAGLAGAVVDLFY